MKLSRWVCLLLLLLLLEALQSCLKRHVSCETPWIAAPGLLCQGILYARVLGGASSFSITVGVLSLYY